MPALTGGRFCALRQTAGRQQTDSTQAAAALAAPDHRPRPDTGTGSRTDNRPTTLVTTAVCTEITYVPRRKRGRTARWIRTAI